MQFLSIDFILLFTICFVLYCILNIRYRNILLLCASCVFIGWYYLPFLLTASLVALFTFFWAQLIEIRIENKKSAKIFFRSGILILVLSWLFFHYIAVANHFVGLLFPGIDNLSVMNSIVFPLGMSFYTFQAIGYLTDVYWQEEKAEHKFIDFLLYMLFFMKFLSGPIERSGDFIKQLKNPQPFNYDFAVLGVKYIFLGLIKKLLIANHLAPHTEIMFNSIHDLSGLQLLMTCLLYPIELYTDFSGYTDIAIGGAYMFGLKLIPNFNSPFGATSTADLWRRWHMSLSFWVRDYIYIPLTASTRRWKTWGVYLSLIITFILLGLWHGIGITFAIYGLIQGIILCWEMKVTFFRVQIPKLVGPYISNALFIVRTYILFALSLLFFRIPSLNDALYFIRNISFDVHESWKEMNIGMSDHFCIVAGSALLLIFVYEFFSRKESLITKMETLPGYIRWIIYFFLIFALFSYGKFDSENFIYLQF